MKDYKESGLSLIELMISTAMVAGLGVAAFNLSEFSRRETKVVTEDIQATISRYGASKLLTRDITAAEPSFNFVSLKDNEGLPFFTLAKNELCRNSSCARKLTLDLKPGELKSRSFYLVIRKGLPDEMAKFTIDPRSTYSGKIYSGINWQNNNENFTISKSKRPHSPWTQNRLLMLTSEIEFYDCKNLTQLQTGPCTISCTPSGSCNYVAKRPYKFLGVVSQDEIDMNDVSINVPDLFLTKFSICRPGIDSSCKGVVDISTGLNSTKKFFEMLPYVPGLDNRTYISPVEVIEYHLRRPDAKSPDHQIELMRSRARLEGTKLIFEKSISLMSGLQSIEFRRNNISNPLIEFKLKKVRMRKTVK